MGTPELPPEWLNQTAPALAEMACRPDVPGSWALTLALSQGLSDPNQVHQGAPLLHATLRALRMESVRLAGGRPAEPVLCPLALEGDWPAGVAALPARERLAALLIAAGADPWVKDPLGQDALDLAVEYGSRTLFSQLLRHPGCPPVAQLWSRTLASEQRQLPWTHLAVNRQWWGLLGDLCAAGANPMAPDNVGWPAAAWAIASEDLKRLNDIDALPVGAEAGMLVRHAWARRQALGLTADRLPVVQLLASLEEWAPLSETDRATAQWAKNTERALAVECGSRYGGTAGWDALPNTEDELASYGYDSRSYRHKVTRGNMKGEWSPVAALLMTPLSTPRNERMSHGKCLPVLNALLSRWDDAELIQWLDAPVRPGLTPRGMLVLALAPTSLCKGQPLGRLSILWNNPSTPGGDDTLKNIRAAHAACEAIAGGKAVAHERIQATCTLWEWLIAGAVQLETSRKGEGLSVWAGLLERMRASGMRPSRDAMEHMMRWAKWGGLQDKNPCPHAFALLRAVVQWPCGQVGCSDHKARMQWVGQCVESVFLLQKTSKEHPHLGPWLTHWPFLDADLKGMGAGVVAQLDAARLSLGVPEAATAPRARPRM